MVGDKFGVKPIWKPEEIEHLKEHWGDISIPAIAKNLNRSISAVKQKAVKLKLGRHIHRGEYITLNQLLHALGRYHGASYTKAQWIKKGLPVKQKKSVNMSYQIIYLDEFWKWAYENRTIIDFSKFEENNLGLEPECHIFLLDQALLSR